MCPERLIPFASHRTSLMQRLVFLFYAFTVFVTLSDSHQRRGFSRIFRNTKENAELWKSPPPPLPTFPASTVLTLHFNVDGALHFLLPLYPGCQFKGFLNRELPELVSVLLRERVLCQCFFFLIWGGGGEKRREENRMSMCSHFIHGNTGRELEVSDQRLRFVAYQVHACNTLKPWPCSCMSIFHSSNTSSPASLFQAVLVCFLLVSPLTFN